MYVVEHFLLHQSLQYILLDMSTEQLDRTTWTLTNAEIADHLTDHTYRVLRPQNPPQLCVRSERTFGTRWLPPTDGRKGAHWRELPKKFPTYSSTHDLSNLGRLPNELLMQIFGSLDAMWAAAREKTRYVSE